MARGNPEGTNAATWVAFPCFWRHLPRASFLGELHAAARRGRGYGARLAPSLFVSRGAGGFPGGFCHFCPDKSGEELARLQSMAIKRSTPQGPPAIFSTFPLLERYKQKTVHATARTDNRKTISITPCPQGIKTPQGFPGGFCHFCPVKSGERLVRVQSMAIKRSTPQGPPAIFSTFPVLERYKQKTVHATARTDNRKPKFRAPSAKAQPPGGTPPPGRQRGFKTTPQRVKKNNFG